MSSHTNLISHTLKVRLIKEINKYRLEKHISALELSAKTGLPEGVIKRLEQQKRLDSFTLSKILFAMDKWFTVKLVEAHHHKIED